MQNETSPWYNNPNVTKWIYAVVAMLLGGTVGNVDRLIPVNPTVTERLDKVESRVDVLEETLVLPKPPTNDGVIRVK